MAFLPLLSMLGALGLVVRGVVARRRVDPWAALAAQPFRPSRLRAHTLSGCSEKRLRFASAVRL